MKLQNSGRKKDSLSEIKRQLAAEELRGMRSQNTQRSVLCYGWLTVTAVSIFAVLMICFLLGLGVISLSVPIVIALIGGTVANGWVLLNTIFKGVFLRRD